MNIGITSIIYNEKEECLMVKNKNMNNDPSGELKRALSKSPPRSNPNMSEAEQRLKFPEKKI